MSENMKRHDERGNCIYEVLDGVEYWREFDESGRKIYSKNSRDRECWWEYENNNIIHFIHSNGLEYWYKQDKNNNCVYYKNYDGLEYWHRYDENNNKIYFKSSSGLEIWYKYDRDNNRTNITEQMKEFEEQKEFLSREEIPRFELMEI